MKRYKSLFIDFDDTIWDTRNNSIAGIRALYEDFNIGTIYPTFESFYEPFWETNQALWNRYHHGEISKETLIRERMNAPFISKGVQKSEAELFELHLGMLDRTARQTALVDGARETLDYLKTKYRLYMLSNGFREVQFRKIENSGLNGYFDHVFLSDDIGYNKPHPKIYYHAMRTTNSRKEESLMIGDNYTSDIVGAQGVKMDQVFFERDFVSYTITTPPTYTIQELTELTEIL